MEGHPDNVAPAVFGGFTIAYSGDGGFAAVRLDVTSPMSFVVLVPTQPLHTKVARGLLPPTVSHTDASFNAGRAALLVAALTGHPELLLDATEDRLHQGYRSAAMPASAELIAELRRDGIAAVLSGAGPTVLAMVARDRVSDVVTKAPTGWSSAELELDRGGVRVLP
jgi:homoserine kinase